MRPGRWATNVRFRLVVATLVVAKLDRHGHDSLPRCRVADDHHKDVLVAKSSGPAPPDGLAEKQCPDLVWNRRFPIGSEGSELFAASVTVAVGRHDGLGAEEFPQGAVFRRLSLVLDQLAGPRPRVVDDHIAACIVDALQFEWTGGGVVGNVENEQDPQAVDVGDRLAMEVGRPQLEARQKNNVVILLVCQPSVASESAAGGGGLVFFRTL